VANFLLKLLFGFRVEGRGKIPDKGGIIIASNHISYLDPPLLGASAKRELFYLAKEGLFRQNRFFAWLIRTYNALPLRSGGDHKAIKTISTLLQEGKAVVIFPEGTRSKTGEFLPPKAGIGFLLFRTGALIVPTYVRGSNKALKDLLLRRERLEVRFGDPLPPSLWEGLEANRECYHKVSEEVMERIKKLSPSYKGNS